MGQLERDEKHLEDALENGEISKAEFSREINELYGSYQDAAREACVENS